MECWNPTVKSITPALKYSNYHAAVDGEKKVSRCCIEPIKSSSDGRKPSGDARIELYDKLGYPLEIAASFNDAVAHCCFLLITTRNGHGTKVDHVSVFLVRENSKANMELRCKQLLILPLKSKGGVKISM